MLRSKFRSILMANLRRLMPLLAAAAFVLSPAAAQADRGDQLFKLLPDDGAANESFGSSVAISGATAIVGARDDDACPKDPNCNSGSAYLFDVATGEQLHKLTADDAGGWDFFGHSVSISATIAIAGAMGDDDVCPADPFCWSGSAYLFDVATGQQLHKLTADDAAYLDIFGFSVSISGDIAIVGAPWDDDACPKDPDCNSGSAYLFDVATGEQLHKLTADDAGGEDRFGWSVSISDGIAIVGAIGNDDACPGDPFCWSGSAYLFDVATGQQLHKLTAEDAAAHNQFGYSVSVSGDTLIVGARDYDDACPKNPHCYSGSAYLFDVTTGQQLHKITEPAPAAYDGFGTSVSIGAGIAIVGAIGDDDVCPGDPDCNSGSAYLFDVSDPENPVQVHKLTADDAAGEDQFGWSVSISDGIAIVGADFNDDNGSKSGSAYLFDAADASDCPWDFDGDGAVGASDLAQLLGSWGPCDDCGDCLADFSDDCAVNAADLAMLLGNWGPCK